MFIDYTTREPLLEDDVVELKGKIESRLTDDFEVDEVEDIFIVLRVKSKEVDSFQLTKNRRMLNEILTYYHNEVEFFVIRE